MKRLSVILGCTSLACLALALPGGSSRAGTMNAVPHEFEPRTRALAHEVNQNFEAVVIEINDNADEIAAIAAGMGGGSSSQVTANTTAIAAHGAQISTHSGRIGANEAAILGNQNAAGVNQVAIGANGSAISANGSAIAVNAQDINTVESAILTVDSRVTALESPMGYASVAGMAFADSRSGTADCTEFKDLQSYYMVVGSGTSCDAMASIQLPHGAEATSLSCALLDNQVGETLQIDLQRVSLSNGGISSLFTAATTQDAPSPVQITDATATTGSSSIDNAGYGYFLRAQFGSGVAPANNMRVYGCSVAYQ